MRFLRSLFKYDLNILVVVFTSVDFPQLFKKRHLEFSMVFTYVDSEQFLRVTTPNHGNSVIPLHNTEPSRNGPILYLNFIYIY